MDNFIPLDQLPDADTKITGFIPLDQLPGEQPSANAEQPKKAPFLGNTMKNYHESLDSVQRVGSKGLRDLAVGTATAPLDLVGADNVSNAINKAVPDVELKNDAEKFGATLVEYGLPSKAAFKIAELGVKKLPQVAEDAPWLLKKAVDTSKFLAKPAAGAAADAIVTNPKDAETIGSMVGGPTAIQTDDSNLEKRAKVGAEGGIIGTAIDTGLRAGIFAKNVISSKLKSGTTPGIENTVAKLMQDTAAYDVDPKRVQAYVDTGMDKAAAYEKVKSEQNQIEAIKLHNLDRRTNMPEGYNPTTGTGSGNIGLIGLERGVTTGGDGFERMVQRRDANKTVISQAVQEVIASNGNGQAAIDKLAQAYHIPMQQAQDLVEQAQRHLNQASNEVADALDQVRHDFGKEHYASASVDLDDATADTLLRMTNQKNDLYRAIDPGNRIPVDTSGIKSVYDSLTTKTSPTDMRLERLASNKNGSILLNQLGSIFANPANADGEVGAAINALNNLGSVKTGQTPTLTYGQIQHDIMPVLSDAIQEFRSAGNAGDLVQSLRSLKGELEATTDQIAASGGEAAAKAQAAKDFYTNDFVPAFVEGTGGKYRDLSRRDKIVPSTTAPMFLKPAGSTGGAEEAVNSLSNIVQRATPENQALAKNAVNQWMITHLAQKLDLRNPEAVTKVIADFKNTYGHILEKFPDLAQHVDALQGGFDRAVNKVGGLRQAVEAAQQNMEATKTKLNKSIFAAAANDPTAGEATVKRLLNPALNPAEEMKKVLAVIGDDQAAKEGLKSLIQENLTNKLFSKTSKTLDSEFTVLKNKLAAEISNPKMRDALTQLYGPADMAKLDAVRNAMDEMDRLNTQGIPGSPTAHLAANANQLRTMLASYYGIVKGQGIFQISKFVSQGLGYNPEAVARKLLIDSLLDPKLGAYMLAKDTNIEAADAIKTYILGHYVNNAPFLTSKPEEKGDNKTNPNWKK